ncbi:2-aminoethylphosphonate ABC transporter substrate-binding protein [Marinactinospora thermotolerans]|uniref:2-aminoethylphosphonate transport system substrate-binding protein n=1 Tax=Marinactinospora thermotolerans DSM 45154 TaxID=1122192 RepID=A0A1T4LE61_9ACTN|nr:2-aminoethylphosphonate ABC transporter substrate-binding protein [Marinactinospora thermotolerans]SJZ52847.1 2-aminoethylphosphonate transport system substrate-binding protein [Marinactinospora thermotolerans DSM 45154]
MRSTHRALAGAALPLLLLGTACGGTGAAQAESETVTVYSADGLKPWYDDRFAEFEEQTGIAVELVEAGSGEVVSRLEKERANVQADVLVTLPPFVQQAAREDLLASYAPEGIEQVPAERRDGEDRYAPLVDNYLSFIRNTEHADPLPDTWEDLLDPGLKGKVQYSTPGQAGDGTAVLLHLQQVMGEQEALDYLGELEANNVGPSSSTGRLQPKVDKGELHVANGDVQMNLTSIEQDGAGFEVFFPADADGERSTLAIPYYAGLVAGAPQTENGKRLLDFLYSAEVQASLSEVYGDPVRDDVEATDERAKRIEELLSGVEVRQPDWTVVLDNLDADLAAYEEAVGR